jgi:hypothetical protein
MQFEIIYKVSPFQEFNNGSLVTYRNENKLNYIKENLLSRTNFFYVKDLDDDFNKCIITNGIDTITTTLDQLIEVIAYVQKIPSITGNNYSNNILENMIKLKNSEENLESYMLENQSLGVFLEESIFNKDFFIVTSLTAKINGEIKNYSVARFIESKLSEII